VDQEKSPGITLGLPSGRGAIEPGRDTCEVEHKMGYQLWTSPITGYRRKGTRLSELRAVLGAGVVARTISEPLQSCPREAPARDAEALLRERGFDAAGVQAAEDGPVVGFVLRGELLDGNVRDHTNAMTSEHLVSDATSLGDLLAVLRGRERVFVLEGPVVRGIITRADLNKPPVRVYLFGLISLLEMHLQFWVSSHYPDDSWQQALNPGRLEAANKLLDLRKGRNNDITLLQCLQFCDKRDLVLQSEELRNKLGFASKGGGATLLTCAEKLRDVLAHSQADLAQESSWEELIKVVESVEQLVHRSDDAVEQVAKASANSARETTPSGIQRGT